MVEKLIVKYLCYSPAHSLIMSSEAGAPSKNLETRKSKSSRTHPACPECGKKLVRAGAIEGVGDAPSNVFQCINRKCPSFSKRYYKRDGKKLVPLARFEVIDLIRRR